MNKKKIPNVSEALQKLNISKIPLNLIIFIDIYLTEIKTRFAFPLKIAFESSNSLLWHLSLSLKHFSIALHFKFVCMISSLLSIIDLTVLVIIINFISFFLVVFFLREQWNHRRLINRIFVYLFYFLISGFFFPFFVFNFVKSSNSIRESRMQNIQMQKVNVYQYWLSRLSVELVVQHSTNSAQQSQCKDY